MKTIDLDESPDKALRIVQRSVIEIKVLMQQHCHVFNIFLTYCDSISVLTLILPSFTKSIQVTSQLSQVAFWEWLCHF